MTTESVTTPGAAEIPLQQAAVPAPAWWKSSYSNHQGGCVEMAEPGPAAVAFRDSKDSHSPVLEFTRGEAAAFVEAVIAGSL
jgi:hypothetical protein